MGRTRQRAKLLAGTVARVDMPGPAQTVQGVRVQPHAGRSGRTALPVLRRPGPRPSPAEPAQIADDRVGVLGSGTVGIDVLHAQHERTSFAPAGQPREQKSPCVAEVQETGGARREPAPDGTGGAHPCFRETMKKTERTVRQQAVTMTPSTCSPASSQPRNTPMTGLTYS